MSTADNLRLAFTEEAKNSALYLIFAEKADSEGIALRSERRR